MVGEPPEQAQAVERPERREERALPERLDLPLPQAAAGDSRLPDLAGTAAHHVPERHGEAVAPRERLARASQENQASPSAAQAEEREPGVAQPRAEKPERPAAALQAPPASPGRSSNSRPGAEPGCRFLPTEDAAALIGTGLLLKFVSPRGVRGSQRGPLRRRRRGLAFLPETEVQEPLR